MHISPEIWTNHFKNLLQSKETRPTVQDKGEWEPSQPFTSREIEIVISASKNRKAHGPDKIYYEHLKQSLPLLKEPLTILLNKCLETGDIPETWRTSKIKMLYKGKGDPETPDSYRGIALESVLFKSLTKLITNRLYGIVDEKLADQQMGFRKKRSTEQTIEVMVNSIQVQLQKKKGRHYIIYVDFEKAFDKVNRRILIEKLRRIAGNTWLTRLASSIMDRNYISIDDSVSISQPIEQTIGVLQGDPLSALLFNVMMHDAVDAIQGEAKEDIDIFIYADDIALGSTNLQTLQKGMNALAKWASENDLTINADKTELAVFRKGGKISREERIVYEDQPLRYNATPKYLGMRLQPTGTTFTLHIKERLIAATRSINDIKHISRMSLKTAMELFQVKVLPIATYGISQIWNHLTKKQLKEIEKLKATYIKRVLCISKFTPSRLAYVMARETFLLDDLRLQHLLSATPAMQSVIEERKEKERMIWPDFYTTDAMMDRRWAEAEFTMRHIVTRLAVHGFHHHVCVKKVFHEPTTECVCEECGGKCSRYHILECKNRQHSLSHYGNLK